LTQSRCSGGSRVAGPQSIARPLDAERVLPDDERRDPLEDLAYGADALGICLGQERAVRFADPHEPGVDRAPDDQLLTRLIVEVNVRTRWGRGTDRTYVSSAVIGISQARRR
jgi:hypothetical protein